VALPPSNLPFARNDSPLESLSVHGCYSAVLFLSPLAQLPSSPPLYLTPALFKYNAEGVAQRPNGVIYAWIDSFLLPEAHEGKADLAWGGDLKRAIEVAGAEQAGVRRFHREDLHPIAS